VLYDNIKQSDRSYFWYNVTLGERYNTGKEHLVVKVVADDFESDPDVFISKKSKFPVDSTTSEWNCEREGSETCIIRKEDNIVGDTLFIGVKCLKECSYSLKIQNTREVLLQESTRTQLMFDAFTTQILKFYIPADVEKIKTQSIHISVLPEDDYTPVDMWLSVDKEFYILEEKPASHLLGKSVDLKMQEGHEHWCTKCWVYAIVNVEKS